MTDKEQITAEYEAMYKAMIAKDTLALGRLLTDDSVLVHMTGHRQPRKEYLSEIASGVLNYYSVETQKQGERCGLWWWPSHLATPDGIPTPEGKRGVENRLQQGIHLLEILISE